jgi:hypothetical protein
MGTEVTALAKSSYYPHWDDTVDSRKFIYFNTLNQGSSIAKMI